MERVQSVRIQLSNGMIGTFWGPPIAEDPNDPQLKVLSLEFEAPRFVTGIEAEASALPRVETPVSPI